MGTILKRACLILAVCLLAAACFLRAQPKITLEQQAEWLQARAELAEARNAVTQAEARLAAIVAKMQQTCPLILEAGRPVCQPPKK